MMQVKKGVLESFMVSSSCYGIIVCVRIMHGDLKAFLGRPSEVEFVKEVMRAGKVMKVKEHVPINLISKKLVIGVIV